MGRGQNAQEMSGRSSSSLPRRQDDQRRHQRRDRGDQLLNLPEGAEKSSVRWVAEPFQTSRAAEWRGSGGGNVLGAMPGYRRGGASWTATTT